MPAEAAATMGRARGRRASRQRNFAAWGAHLSRRTWRCRARAALRNPPSRCRRRQLVAWRSERAPGRLRRQPNESPRFCNTRSARAPLSESFFPPKLGVHSAVSGALCVECTLLLRVAGSKSSSLHQVSDLFLSKPLVNATCRRQRRWRRVALCLDLRFHRSLRPTQNRLPCSRSLPKSISYRLIKNRYKPE